MSTVQEQAAFGMEALQALDASEREPALVSDSRRTSRARLLRGRELPLPLGDLATLAVVCALVMAWTGDVPALRLAGFPPLCVLAMVVGGAYQRRLRTSVLDGCGIAVAGLSAAAMIAIAAGSLLTPGEPIRGVVVRAWLLGSVVLGIRRAVAAARERRGRATGTAARRAVIVGAGEVGARLGRRLEESPSYGLIPVAFLDADPPPPEAVGGRRAPVVGHPSDLGRLVESRAVQHVILAFPRASDQELLPGVRRCCALGVPVSVVPRLFDSMSKRVVCEPIGGVPVTTLRPTDPDGTQFALKHALDRVGAAVALVALAPLLAVLVVLVKRSSPGPVLFRQRRVGRDGKVFDMLKFRTMAGGDREAAFVPEAGLAPGGVEGADRRTGIGMWLRRTSLDELPQLVNVLRGDMSLIGPRPERPRFVDVFTADLPRYRDRHRVRSGMTGWSQVHGLRGQCSIADRVEFDNYYIENWSLRMDLKILLMTVIAVMRPTQEPVPSIPRRRS